MSNELNDRLRAALRPVDPGERFTRSVLARVASGPLSRPAVRDRNAVEEIPGRPNRAKWGIFGAPWLAATALALCVALGLVIAYEREARHAQAGLEARRQVMEALRLTSEKLDLAYRVVKDKDLPGTGKRGA